MTEKRNIHPSISKEDALAIYNVTHSTEIIDVMMEFRQKILWSAEIMVLFAILAVIAFVVNFFIMMS